MVLSRAGVNEVVEEFTVTAKQVEQAAKYFEMEIASGLKKAPSSLQILKSYLRLPTGKETGEYLALDFGGTNVRALLVQLQGGTYQVVKKVKRPLISEKYDYTSAETKAEELFAFIAKVISEIAEPGKRYQLGHTFSFGTEQSELSDARLISWSKEIRVQGVEGEMVNALLERALSKGGLSGVVPVAILNDTVASALAAAYRNPAADIGSICGTGHNTTYMERRGDFAPMFVNLESGGFNRLPFTRYDVLLDGKSKCPGTQLLEKMVSGKYLGRLLQCVLETAFGIKASYEPDGKDLALILDVQNRKIEAVETLAQKLGAGKSQQAVEGLRLLTQALVTRSARLVAATYIGILRHMDMEAKNGHTVAVDGSLYQKMPGYAQEINRTLAEIIKEEQIKRITVRFEGDGSGIGAAIAAAIAVS